MYKKFPVKKNVLKLLGFNTVPLVFASRKGCKDIQVSPKESQNFLGKGETSVKANKTAFAVLFAKFAVFRLGGALVT